MYSINKYIRTDLPEKRNKSLKFMSLIMAIMVFLSILSISGFNIFNKILGQWVGTAKGTITIQIPSSNGFNESIKINNILSDLNNLEKIKSAEIINENELRKLLKPWIGDELANKNFPLPVMIDVTTLEDYVGAIDDIKQILSDIAPGSRIDSHRVWFEKVIKLTDGLRTLSLIIVLIINLALILTIINITLSSMIEFSNTIELLHILGANDYYIAKQFAKKTFISAGYGSIIGCVLGGIIIFLLGWLGASVESGFLPDFVLGFDFWLSIPFIAMLSFLISIATSFLVVLKNLRILI